MRKSYLWVEERLKSHGIENYFLEAKLISEYAHGDAEKIESMINRRIKREPLQYILGGWEFYGDEYKLTPDCLIPRPETEFLVEYIINNAPENAYLLDLCCGSGCIAISALKRRTDLRAISVDISSGAIDTAVENAHENGVSDRICFFCLDIFKDCEEIIGLNMKIDLIVSNPPYLTQCEVGKIKSERTELSYEPETAFFGGIDGLDFYRFIVDNYSRKYKSNTVTAFEVGKSQYKPVVSMFEDINFSCDIILDYQKIERVIIGTLHKI